ncbi:MAG: NUDIX domain-containing protein [Bacilli bacterium]|nr:NUDIX domain-containing protein [Bacilli bacterium]
MNLKKIIDKNGNEIIMHTHIGVYGLVIEDDRILLIDKVTGPYDGLLDLPGGSFEFGETPEEALEREFKEEVGIDLKEYELFHTGSVIADWNYKNKLIKVHHIGIFYKINKYEGKIKESIELDKQNDDSLGATFHSIKDLKKKNLSLITILELEKLGYNISED